MEPTVHDVTGTGTGAGTILSSPWRVNGMTRRHPRSSPTSPQATRYASRRCLESASRPCPGFLDPPSPWGTGETLELELITFSTGARVRCSIVQVSHSVV